MPKINQKYGIPRIAGAKGFPLSRGKFLDGTVKTYYGPGQPPSSGADHSLAGGIDPWTFTAEVDEPTHDDIFNSSHRFLKGAGNTPQATDVVDGSYLPPADWPGVGRLLRVPQVVWLSSMVPVAGRDYVLNDGKIAGGNNGVTLTFTFVSTVEEEEALGHTPISKTYFPVYNYYARLKLNNLYLEEHTRRLELFASVKATIEALRPGRTFVDIPAWIGDAADQWGQFGADRYLHALAPPDSGDSDPWFGVNFLHVYAGTAALDLIGSAGRPTRIIDADWATQFAGASGSAAWDATKARLAAAYPKFARYAAKIYGQDLAWSDETGTFSYDMTRTDTDSIPPRADEQAATIAEGMINTDIREMIAQFANRDSSSDDLLTDTAGQLADYGVSYEGDASDLTEESLIALIAAHFGFDPETGKDLG